MDSISDSQSKDKEKIDAINKKTLTGLVTSSQKLVNKCDRLKKDISLEQLKIISAEINNKISIIIEIENDNSFSDEEDILKLKKLKYYRWKLESFHRNFHSSYLEKIISDTDAKFKETEKMNNELTAQIADSQKNIDIQNVEMQNLKNESTKETENIAKKMDSLGATFLSMVLTVSVITTMISIVLKVKFIFIPMIFVGTTWLLISSKIGRASCRERV